MHDHERAKVNLHVIMLWRPGTSGIKPWWSEEKCGRTRRRMSHGYSIGFYSVPLYSICFLKRLYLSYSDRG